MSAKVEVVESAERFLRRQSGDLSGRRGSHAMKVPLSENDMVSRLKQVGGALRLLEQIGRASCRERV